MASWGRITPGGYRNHHPFGRALKHFLLASRECWLPKYGWLDGGCLILCDALVEWGQGGIFPGGTLRLTGWGAAILDHAFAYARFTDAACVLMDGDGLQSEEGMRKKMRVLEHCNVDALRLEDCSKSAIGIPRDRKKSKAIAEGLLQEFGPYHPRLLAR